MRTSNRLALVTTLVLVSIGAAACGDSQRSESRALPRTFAGSEVHYFSDLAEMIRTVDVVVLGSIQTAGPGRVVGPPGEEVLYRQVTLEVTETWRGTPPESTLFVETLDAQTYAAEWRVPGEEVLVFLTRGDARPGGGNFFFPTNSQSVFLVDGEDLRPTSTDPFHERVAALSKSELRSRVRG